MNATNKAIKFSYTEDGEEKQATRKIYEKDKMEYIIFGNKYVPILDEQGFYLSWMKDIQVLENFNVSSASKMGRPEAENPKSKPIHVRLDNEDMDKLERYCKKRNISKTEGIRHGIRLLPNIDK